LAVGDVKIRNLALAGLKSSSMVRVAKIASLEPSRILRAVGKLSRAESTAVLAAIRNALV
jgi:mRNA-degrading endonuclease toxin of MazEF toxin-antitoxin module